MISSAGADPADLAVRPPAHGAVDRLAFLPAGIFAAVLAAAANGALAHQALAILALLVGWLGLSRYMFGGEALVPFVNVAAHGSILFLSARRGRLTLRPDAGIARLLASEASAAAWRGGCCRPPSSCRCWRAR